METGWRMHVGGIHDGNCQQASHAWNGIMDPLVMQTLHANATSHETHHLYMHGDACHPNQDVLHVNGTSSTHVVNNGKQKKQNVVGKHMTFIDETLNVKKKIKKKQGERCYNHISKTKMRKALTNEPFLKNYFEYDNSSGSNQLKKFKLIECSQSKIVTSEIIPNVGTCLSACDTSETTSEITSNTGFETASEIESKEEKDIVPIENNTTYRAVESVNNDSTSNINLLLALLYVFTGDSNEQSEHATI